MIRPVTVAFLFLAASAAVMAQDELASAQNCWNLMPDHFGIGASVDLLVELDKGVVKSVEVTRYSPDTEVGYGIATSAVRSVEMCGPYGQVTDKVEMTFQADTPPESTGIVPLPGKQ